MSKQFGWLAVWQELQDNVAALPPCPFHPEYPHVNTLAQSVTNDIVEVGKRGITVRSHRTGNQRFLRAGLFKVWWNHLLASGSASLGSDPRTEHEYVVGAIIATCLT